MKKYTNKKIFGWAIVPKKRGAKKINKFLNGIKCDYYGVLAIPQFGIYPRSYSKMRVERNCNDYEKVVAVEIKIKQ